MSTMISSVPQPAPAPVPAPAPLLGAPALPGAGLFAEWMGLDLQGAPEAMPAAEAMPAGEAPVATPGGAAPLPEPAMAGDAQEQDAPARPDPEQHGAAEAAPPAPAMPAMSMMQSLAPALSAALAAPHPATAAATPVAAAGGGARRATAPGPATADAQDPLPGQWPGAAVPARERAQFQLQAQLQAQAPAAAARLPETAGAAPAPAPAGAERAAAAPDALPPVVSGAAAPAAATADATTPALKLAGAAPAWQQPLREALGERLQLQLSRHAETAVIRLDPPNLGRIDIAIRNIAGALEVNISATHSEVVRQLHAVSEHMRSDLAQRQFADVSVTIHAAPRAPAAGQHLAGDQQGRQRQGEPAPDESRAAAPGQALAEAGNPASTFTLNSREPYA